MLKEIITPHFCHRWLQWKKKPSLKSGTLFESCTPLLRPSRHCSPIVRTDLSLHHDAKSTQMCILSVLRGKGKSIYWLKKVAKLSGSVKVTSEKKVPVIPNTSCQIPHWVTTMDFLILCYCKGYGVVKQHFLWLLSWNLGASNSWNPHGLSRPLTLKSPN